MRGGWGKTALKCATLSAGIGLAACVPTTVVGPGATTGAASLAVPPMPLSPESLELTAYYERVQEGLIARGLMRVDGGGPDTPFTTRNLIDNFINIALFDEFTSRGDALVQGANEAVLHRWRTPVRVGVTFGPTVPVEKQRKDVADIEAYVARLSRITGHPMRVVRSGANFNIFVVNEAERRALGPRLRQIFPGIPPTQLNAVTNMPRSDFCLVFASAPLNTGTYTQAVAVIRAEHPDELRLSCVHEEIAQGLGLPNDSPYARPSIFNDDEEFARLTTQDEMMLAILYDARLQPGMNLEQARAAAAIVAAELTGRKPLVN